VEVPEERLLLAAHEAGPCRGGQLGDPGGVAGTDLVVATRSGESFARERANRLRQGKARLAPAVAPVLRADEAVVDEGREGVDQVGLCLAGDLLDGRERRAAGERGQRREQLSL